MGSCKKISKSKAGLASEQRETERSPSNVYSLLVHGIEQVLTPLHICNRFENVADRKTYWVEIFVVKNFEFCENLNLCKTWSFAIGQLQAALFYVKWNNLHERLAMCV